MESNQLTEKVMVLYDAITFSFFGILRMVYILSRCRDSLIFKHI